jgi:hypothetical protein
MKTAQQITIENEDATTRKKVDPKTRIEIAYSAWGQDDRLTSKRKVVTAAKLSATIDKLRDQGALNIVTREAE